MLDGVTRGTGCGDGEVGETDVEGRSAGGLAHAATQSATTTLNHRRRTPVDTTENA
jgi:hypothetical protein